MPKRDYPVTIFYSEEDGGYIAVAPDLKGCSAFGETPQEARRDSTPLPEPTRMSA
jgi:predicted RNase H-like HicB family nuclease